MRLSTLALGAILAAFGAGIIALFGISFERGEVYPPLSSFRTDPLGSHLLYDSLAALPGRMVERNLSADPQAANATLLMLGTGIFAMSDLYGKQVDERTAAGARVVFSFNSVTRSANLKPSHLKWGVTVDFGNINAVVDAGGTARETLVYFRNLDREWRTLKTGRWGATVIERPLNKGALVLSAESFPFTNESLARSRDTELLSKVIGPASHIIFDEFHLGIRENPGVALLMRKFRLHALVAALAIAALLFVWSVSAHFPPIPEHTEADDEAIGFAARSGMIRLLQRSIPASKLMITCAAEWEKLSSADPRAPRIRELAAHAAPANATGVYREIQSILEQK